VTKVARVCEVIFGAPVAAVDEEDDRMRALASGKADIDELIWVLAVRDSQVRIGRFLFETGLALHAKQYRPALPQIP
jgi:hypothetical protein